MKKIELHHLDRECRKVSTHAFPVRWPGTGSARESAILESCTISGDQAEFLAQLFDRAFLLIPDLSLCGHFPNYGIRYFEGDTLVLETTVCLSCSNWICVTEAESGRYQVTPDARDALSSELQRILPLYAEEVI